MKYSIDTSIFVRYERYYDRDDDSKLWQILEDNLTDGTFVISKLVIVELEQKSNNMTKWIKEKASTNIITPNRNVQTIIQQFTERYPNWIDPNSTKNSADPFGIALAKDMNCAVLSNEKRNQTFLNNLSIQSINVKNINIKIADICRLEDIKHFDLTQFLATLI